MSGSERAVFGALLPGLPDAGLDEFLSDFRRQAPVPLRLALPAAVFAAAWLAPLLAGRLPPLWRLEPEGRERALAAMARSRFYAARQLLLLLKLVAGLSRGKSG